MTQINQKDADQDQMLAVLSHRIEDVEKEAKELKERVRNLEKKVWGASAIIAALITIIGIADALYAKEIRNENQPQEICTISNCGTDGNAFNHHIGNSQQFLVNQRIYVQNDWNTKNHLYSRMNFFLSILFATTLWVQVPQWNDDWSNCAVDVPDSSCHWYIVNADNTFGEGFDWETAPWFDVNGLQDIANLHDDVIDSGYQYTVEALNNAKSN